MSDDMERFADRAPAIGFARAYVQYQADSARAIGFAIAQFEEAMGFLEDCRRSDARYWAYKACVRGRDMLRSVVP